MLTIGLWSLGCFLCDEELKAGFDNSLFCVLSLFMPHLPLSICVNESL